QDAHRALELLEAYHDKLTDHQDLPLKNAIENVIRIFKSCLFQALLDIQEFYEVTLMNNEKSVHQKMMETLSVATNLELNSEALAFPIAYEVSDLFLLFFF
ncbi:hypothetical protein HELRODRAFT_83782, partial [Helobdella robusta]|uniref:L27 domain-containing protein n=1 Tax=Helobdella robusta TaxID=6412 RepID=T1G5A2_HELRO